MPEGDKNFGGSLVLAYDDEGTWKRSTAGVYYNIEEAGFSHTEKPKYDNEWLKTNL